MIDISLIVPVYKVPEKFLRKCIDSLIAQTYKNIEIILVDDGSPDNCGKICDEYQKKDGRIVVVHQSNKGLSGARNTGFNHANGKWITFVDGDDWIEKNTCETYIKYAKSDFDIIISSVIKDYGKKIYYYNYDDKYVDNKVYENEEVKYLQSEVLDFNGNIAFAYGKLIRRDFLKKYEIKHDELLKQGAEGIEFNVRLFEKANKVLFIKKYLYHYMYNDQSISTTHDIENHKYVLKCFEKIKDFILNSKNKDELLEKFYNRMLYVIITTAISGYFNPSNNEKFSEKKYGYKKYLENPLVKESLKNGKENGLGFKRKIVLRMIKFKFYSGIDIFAKIRKFQKKLNMK